MLKKIQRKLNSKAFTLISKKTKGFTLIELIVVIAIIAVLVLIAMPKLQNHLAKAELVRIQHDVKVMEGNMEEKLIDGETAISSWDDNAKDLHKLVLADRLYENEGHAKNVQKAEPIKTDDIADAGNVAMFANTDDSTATKGYKIIPTAEKKQIKTRLKGTFYTNSLGKVYYEPDKPLKANKKENLANCEDPVALGYDFDHTTGTIKKYTGGLQHLVIPSSFLVDGQCYPVLIIGRGAFMNGGYKTITIPEGVKKIEEDAFKNNDLEKIVIPSTVTDIGNDAFAGNDFKEKEDVIIHSKPGDVTISNGGGFTSSGGASFTGGNVVINTGSASSGGSGSGGSSNSSGSNPGGNGSTSGTSNGNIVSNGTITIDKDKGIIKDYQGKDKVVVIPEIVIVDGQEVVIEKIEKAAYQGKGLITVVMPSGLRRIEDYAFAGNQLIAVHIPENINHIGNYAFAFNELSNGKSTIDTIKSIKIKNNEYINKLDGLGNIKESITGVNLLDHVFVTSNSKHVVVVEEEAVKLNKEGLIAKISQANALVKEDYIEGWNNFQSKLSEANTINDSKKAKQNEINKIIEELDLAIKALVKKANKTNLIAKINHAEALNESSYSSGWSELQNKLALAKEVNNNEKASQGQVDSALSSLEAAIDTLVGVTIHDAKGPGPKTLVAGTMKAGYFGLVPASELFTGEEISSAVGITQGILQNNDAPWLKFAIDGKIIYKAQKSHRHTISWDHINSKGAANGSKTVTKGGNNYKVRLMKGALTNPSNNAHSDKGAKGSEWNRLMLPIHEKANNNTGWYDGGKYVESNVPNWTATINGGKGFTDADLNTHNSHGNGSYHWCQEQVGDTTTSRVLRGYLGVSYSTRFTSHLASDYMGWSAVLELSQ